MRISECSTNTAARSSLRRARRFLSSAARQQAEEE
ncbi:hypothetical protein [Oscillibacter sp. MSJ-31]